MNPEHEEMSHEAFEVNPKRDSGVELAVDRQDHKTIEALESLPEDEAREASKQDVVDALRGGKLDDESREAMAEIVAGLKLASTEVNKDNEAMYRGVLEHMMQERYHMTIAQFLGAFKPTKLEYLNPAMALSSETAIWALAKTLDVEPEDLSLKEKAEFRWKVGGDVFKIMSLVAKVFPQARAASVPLNMIGNSLGNMGNAMEKVNDDPEATFYQMAREVTLAALPRDAEGNIDMNAVLKLVSDAGGLMEVAGKGSDIDPSYLKQVATWVKNNPDKLVKAIQQIDKTVRA